MDAHHHVWDPVRRRHAWLDGLPALGRRFWLDDYVRACLAQGVGASILVQVLADTAETEEFLTLAVDAGPVAGVVGWLDLAGPEVADEIARLRALPGGDRLCGIRHLVQDEADPAWLDRPDVRRGLAAVGSAGLVYDLLVRPAQWPAAVRVVTELPEVQFVLDHAGKPDIAGGGFEPWSQWIAEVAGRPNVVCKFSGLVTEAGPDWDAARIAPYAQWLLGRFGPDRLLFGSDWPVCTLAASYAEVFALARDLLAPRLSPHELDAVLGGNAVRAYGLRT